MILIGEVQLNLHYLCKPPQQWHSWEPQGASLMGKGRPYPTGQVRAGVWEQTVHSLSHGLANGSQGQVPENLPCRDRWATSWDFRGIQHIADTQRALKEMPVPQSQI